MSYQLLCLVAYLIRESGAPTRRDPDRSSHGIERMRARRPVQYFVLYRYELSPRAHQLPVAPLTSGGDGATGAITSSGVDSTTSLDVTIEATPPATYPKRLTRKMVHNLCLRFGWPAFGTTIEHRPLNRGVGHQLMCTIPECVFL